jgi:hypothetical protein
LVGQFLLFNFGKAVGPTIEIRTGVKPVSIFGFVHRIFGSIVGPNLHRDFPQLKKETDAKPKGMNAFIIDYVLDLSLLDKIDGYEEVGGSNEHSDADGPDTPGWVKGDVV